MKRLTMQNGEVVDEQQVPDRDRCPQCGRPLAYEEDRGDATAYVHATEESECLV